MTLEWSLNWSRTHTKADSWKTNKQRRLRLHIDDIDHDSVRKYFQTWRLGNVEMSFKIRYRVYRPMKEVERIFWIEWIRFSPPSLPICFYNFFFSLKRMNVTDMGSHVQTRMELIKAVYGSLKERIFGCSLWLKRFFDRCRWSLCGRVYVGFYTHKKKWHSLSMTAESFTRKFCQIQSSTSNKLSHRTDCAYYFTSKKLSM